MSWEAWFTLAVALTVVVILVADVAPPGPAMFSAVVVLLVAGVVTPAEGLSGFSNPAPFTVAALFVVARAVERTGALQPVLGALLGAGNGERTRLARLLVPTALASGVLANTPIVATLVPQVSGWAQRRGRSPSAYLMPLSFAAVLGGLLTVLGTSTNLVVSGLLEETGAEPLGLFEITRLGAPVAVAGLLVLIAATPRLLPARIAARRDLDEAVREFVVDMTVEADGPLDGVRVEEGGLRHLAGVYLVQIERGDDLIAPVAPDTVLRGGDALRFVGRANHVVDLTSIRGLAAVEEPHGGFDTSRAAFFEVVVGSSSPLVGRTLREAGFRSRYQAAVVAIHRAGQRLDAKLGDVRLRVGDTLLVIADRDFRSRWYDRNDFLLVSPLAAAPPLPTRGAVVVVVAMVGVVVASATGLLSLLEASLLAALATVATGTLTVGEARRAVDLDVVLLIGSALGLGVAAAETGLASELADLFLRGPGDLGRAGALAGVVVTTVVLTELITNTAAAALVFPFAVAIASELGEDPRGWAVAVAVAASASFLTPIGYQTNTMVYGPGGYRFGDYARLGAPLTVVVMTLTVVLVPQLW